MPGCCAFWTGLITFSVPHPYEQEGSMFNSRCRLLRNAASAREKLRRRPGRWANSDSRSSEKKLFSSAAWKQKRRGASRRLSSIISARHRKCLPLLTDLSLSLFHSLSFSFLFALISDITKESFYKSHTYVHKLGLWPVSFTRRKGHSSGREPSSSSSRHNREHFNLDWCEFCTSEAFFQANDASEKKQRASWSPRLNITYKSTRRKQQFEVNSEACAMRRALFRKWLCKHGMRKKKANLLYEMKKKGRLAVKFQQHSSRAGE